jgi:hypothetical protein
MYLYGVFLNQDILIEGNFIRTDLVLRDPKGIHGRRIPLLFKIELQGNFSPWIPLIPLTTKSALRNRNRMIASGYGKATKLYERSLGNSAFPTRNKPLWGVWFEESIHSI